MRPICCRPRRPFATDRDVERSERVSSIRVAINADERSRILAAYEGMVSHRKLAVLRGTSEEIIQGVVVAELDEQRGIIRELRHRLAEITQRNLRMMPANSPIERKAA